MHAVNKILAVESDGGVEIDILVVIQREDFAGGPAIPNATPRARDEAILPQRNGMRETGFQLLGSSKPEEIGCGVSPPLLKCASAVSVGQEQLRAMGDAGTSKHRMLAAACGRAR